MVPFLKGHQLFDHVDGTSPMPPPIVDDAPNPTYTQWVLRDQLILSVINSSLSAQVLAQVLDCNTTHDAWTTLQTLFSSQSSTIVMQTQYQLATLKRALSPLLIIFIEPKPWLPP